MAKEQQYIQQLTDLGVYDPAFDGAIHVLCIQERELSRAMKEWKATAPDPKTAPSITDRCTRKFPSFAGIFWRVRIPSA